MCQWLLLVVLPLFIYSFIYLFIYLFICLFSGADLGRRLTSVIPGSSVFFFGAADAQEQGLVARRKAVGWFKTPANYSSLNHDVGAVPSARYGLTGNY